MQRVGMISKCSLAEESHIHDSEENGDRIEVVEVSFMGGNPSSVTRERANKGIRWRRKWDGDDTYPSENSATRKIERTYVRDVSWDTARRARMGSLQ